jgi:hypothetical protein
MPSTGSTGGGDDVDPEALAELDRVVVAILTSAGRACTAEQAGLIRKRLIGRKRLNDPAAYVAAAVRRDPAAAFALALDGLAGVNGRKPPPARELIAARGKVDPGIAKRGAALARELLENRPGTVQAEPGPDPDEEFPF